LTDSLGLILLLWLDFGLQLLAIGSLVIGDCSARLLLLFSSVAEFGRRPDQWNCL
jgi:hypothetical protein